MQVKVLPVSDKYNDYAKRVAEILENENVRAEVDSRNEKLGYKIREARLEKVPYMLIVGENEQANQLVSVRKRDEEVDKQDLGAMDIPALLEMLVKDI